MAMPDLARRYTVADVLAFPEDGKRYELIGGGLWVSPAPSPRHQELVCRLAGLLRQYCAESAPAFRALASPADISWDDETLVQPDLFVVPAAQATNDWSTYRDLVLAVEVLSPSSGRADRVEKRRLYQARRVATYWIVDHDSLLVEVWRPEDGRPEIATEELRWRPAPDTPDLVVPLARLFADLPA
jgi:Uma2 family endonuclease